MYIAPSSMDNITSTPGHTEHRSGLSRAQSLLTGKAVATTSLCLLALYITHPFLVALAWAVIVVVSTWPLNLRLRCTFPKRSNACIALFLSACMGATLLGILLPISIMLGQELHAVLGQLRTLFENDPNRIIAPLARIPYLGRAISSLFLERQEINTEISDALSKHSGVLFSFAAAAAREVTAVLGTMVLIVFTSFFLYRDGDILAQQCVNILWRYVSSGAVEFLHTAWKTIHGVVYGVVFTAIAQGILAGIGFYATGAPIPLVLGGCTILMALFPFGAPLLYVPTALWMYANDYSLYSVIGLLLWGICVVSTIDNVLRPYFLSQATKLSVILAALGLIGGMMSFGLIGMFIGPVILALAQTLWCNLSREYKS